MIRRAIQHLREAHDSFRQTQQIYLVLVAVLIGLLGGLAAVGFRLLIRVLNQGFWHQGQYSLDYIAGPLELAAHPAGPPPPSPGSHRSQRAARRFF